MKKQKQSLLTTIRKNLKKLSKRCAEAVNALAVAAAGLQASGMLSIQPAAIQLKIMLGLLGLNMIVHRIKNPHEVEEAKKFQRKKK